MYLIIYHVLLYKYIRNVANKFGFGEIVHHPSDQCNPKFRQNNYKIQKRVYENTLNYISFWLYETLKPDSRDAYIKLG